MLPNHLPPARQMDRQHRAQANQTHDKVAQDQLSREPQILVSTCIRHRLDLPLWKVEPARNRKAYPFKYLNRCGSKLNLQGFEVVDEHIPSGPPEGRANPDHRPEQKYERAHDYHEPEIGQDALIAVGVQGGGRRQAVLHALVSEMPRRSAHFNSLISTFSS